MPYEVGLLRGVGRVSDRVGGFRNAIGGVEEEEGPCLFIVSAGRLSLFRSGLPGSAVFLTGLTDDDGLACRPVPASSFTRGGRGLSRSCAAGRGCGSCVLLLGLPDWTGCVSVSFSFAPVCATLADLMGLFWRDALVQGSIDEYRDPAIDLAGDLGGGCGGASPLPIDRLALNGDLTVAERGVRADDGSIVLLRFGMAGRSDAATGGTPAGPAPNVPR